MKWTVRRGTIAGTAQVPGDKSIAHRALMLAGVAEGTSRIGNLPAGEDVAATLHCMVTLGARVERGETISLTSTGVLQEPGANLDARNSGTTMRLLSGLLAGQRFASCLVGDSSLSRRPMERVIEPLRAMGAEIEATEGRAPLLIRGRPLRGIRYALPVDSAQVKSAILLAGLFAEGDTTVVERVPTRDHTERMLAALGVPVRREDGAITVREGPPCPFALTVPGDASSAAFLFAAGVLTTGEVTVTGLGANPTRTGFLRLLSTAGASIRSENVREEMGEPVADITVGGSAGNPLSVSADDVPALVDELPLAALLATQADGRSVVRGAAELRVKETDRIAAVTESLSAMGASIRELPDGFEVDGPSRLQGCAVHARGDHRLAMMLAVAGSVADGETRIDGAEAAAVSFPKFVEVMRALGASIDVE